MRGARYLSLMLFLALSAWTLAQAQQHVTLGNATDSLTGPWKFHIGDNLAWAQPGFNDSDWGTMDLTPPPGSYDPVSGGSGFVPGWTARGYKSHFGYAWYRLRVSIQNRQSALALKMPDNFDDAYQVYVDGQIVGEFGRFNAQGVTAYASQPRAFPLPTGIRSGPVTIAVRMWMAPATLLIGPSSGGLHGTPILGQASAIRDLLRLDWDVLDRTAYSLFFVMAVVLLALLVAFGLFWLDRRELAYLWLGLTCAAILTLTGIQVMAVFYTAGSFSFLLRDAVSVPLLYGLWVLFWAYWFRLEGMARLHRMVWTLVLLLATSTAMLRDPLYGTAVPVGAVVWLLPITLTLKMLLGVLLVWVTYRGIRKDGTEGWLALPAVVLVAVSLYQEELFVLHVPVGFFLFGVAVAIDQVGTIFSLLVITVLMLRRFMRGQREREQWKQEIEQARQVQQVLIPEALPLVRGFTLESEYRPAQQVGGDFFQIIEGADGGILIVLGDVSGKGMQAAMLVSLIVGAVRMAAESTSEAMSILQALNRRLCGRMHGHFATCVAAHVMPNGEATIANAGHLPPYVNGREMAMTGSLPLGMVESAEFEQTRFTLEPGDRLTLMTDGVVEAQNAGRELFGFTRTNDLVQQDKSAAEIAAAAQNFGQQDDITVIRIFRSAVSLGAPRLDSEACVSA